jgi:hypothetical protein
VTVFRALMDKLWALTPMCNFEQPEVLCSNEELFYRRLWALFNNDMTALVNGRTTQGENE